jgi:hypothetical protein
MWDLGCAGDVAVTPETCMGYERMHDTMNPSNAQRTQKGTDEDKQAASLILVLLALPTLTCYWDIVLVKTRYAGQYMLYS